MKILVCGGRKYRNARLVRQTMMRLKPDSLVVGEGNADEAAMTWAKWAGIPCRQYCADWKNFGLAAGPIRNRQMLQAERPELVVAFPGGKGTANMVQQARNAGVPVQAIEDDTIQPEQPPIERRGL